MVGFSSSGLRDGKLSYILRSPEKKHRGGVSALALSRGGASVFSAGRDGTVREWNAVPLSKRDCPEAPYADLSSVGVSDNAHKTFDEHVDWVNDIVFLQGGERLVSCSSDTTVKVWNTAMPNISLRTLTEHTDYVKALSCVPANRVASASLDGSVIVWDLVTGRVQMKCGGELDGKPSPSSIYCLSGSSECHSIVAGSTDRSISVYDLRTGERVVRLRGHTDSVRCVVFKYDGSAVLSGSTDTTVKYWDLRMERCIRSFDSYTSDSIWALTADRDFSTFLSGGRDGTIWQYCSQTELASNIVDRADVDPRSNMILDLAMTEDKSGVWVSTTGSTIRLWPVPTATSANGSDERRSGDATPVGVTPPETGDFSDTRTPLFELRGLPGIITYKILNDRRHVLTCDANKEYCIWNITEGKFLKSLGILKPEDGHDIESVAKSNDVEVSIPSWFSVDIRLGSLTIHLVKKYVFGAEIYAVDAGLQADSEEVKVNIGEHVIRGLFAKWLKEYKETYEDSGDENYMNGNKDAGSDDQASDSRTQAAKGQNLPPYEFPVHIPVIVTEGASPVPVLLKRVGLFDGNEEKKIPSWVVELVRDNRTPIRTVEKMAFSLQPAEDSDLPPLQTTALNAPRVLRVRKVASYIAEHLPDDTAIDDPEIEILCNGQIIQPQTSLATVKEFVWKSPDDLKLNYRRSIAQTTR